MLRLLIQTYERMSWLGVEGESNLSLKRSIYCTNRFSMGVLASNFFTGLALASYSGNVLPGIVSILVGVFYLTFLAMNARGYFNLSRMFFSIGSSLGLLILSIIFTHETHLDYYFIIVIISTAMMFDSSERRMLRSALFVAIVCFVVEATCLETLLPSYNLMRNLEQVNQIYTLSIVVFVVYYVRVLMQIVQRNETDAQTSQMALLAYQQQLFKENSELQLFTSTAAHDLKSPIRVAKSFMNLLEKGIEQLKPQTELQEYIGFIKGSLGKQEHTVTDFLEHFKVCNFNYVDHEVLRLNTLLEHLFIDYLRQHPACELVLPAENVEVRSNRFLLTMILQNLVENGFTYNDSERPTVRVAYEQTEGFLLLRVVDNGLGVPLEWQDKIFEPFTRYHRPSEREGTGLGLAGARMAAEKLGGSLRCTLSAPGGSVFELCLPV